MEGWVVRGSALDEESPFWFEKCIVCARPIYRPDLNSSTVLLRTKRRRTFLNHVANVFEPLKCQRRERPHFFFMLIPPLSTIAKHSIYRICLLRPRHLDWRNAALSGPVLTRVHRRVPWKQALLCTLLWSTAAVADNYQALKMEQTSHCDPSKRSVDLSCFQFRRRIHPSHSSNNNKMLGLYLSFLFYLMATVVTAQTTSCSCSPLQYKMQLNLLSQCPPSNVTSGSDSGITRIECSISGDGNNLTPTSVTSYRIAELGLDLAPVRVKNVQNASLVDDDTISFMSTTNTNPGFVSGGLQVQITGINSDSQSVTLEFLVQYSNLCNIPPFSYGDSVGWLKFVSAQFALRQCLLITWILTSTCVY